MKRRYSLTGLLALFPAALGSSAASATVALSVPLCVGGGAGATMLIPVAPSPLPAPDNPCCQKGCHAAGQRKRLGRST